MISLREYQQEFKDAIAAAWLTVRSVLAVMPTGGGKTIIFSSIMFDHPGASAAIVHRKEIVAQISVSLARLGVKHRIIAPPATVAAIRRKHYEKVGKNFIDPHAKAGVVSVQTLTSPASGRNAALQRWLKQITLCVYDEGHHYVDSGLWAKAVDVMAAAKLLFVTATPERADGLGLGDSADGFAQAMVQGPTTQWLIDEGYLSRFVYRAPSTDLNVQGLAVTASGDFNSKALRARVVESHLVGDVVDQYLKFAPGQQALIFSTDVQTAHEQADAFVARGVNTVALSGKTDQRERETELHRFETGALQAVANVDLFDEGFDVPAASCAILARPTQSLAKFLQMVGRVLRPVYADGYDLETRQGRLDAQAAGPKPFAVIIDPVRNWERHGMPNWPRRWTLAGKDKGSRGAKSDAIPQKVCTACTQPYEAFYVACPFCGHVLVPGGRARPEQVDGDLIELDVEGMAALFAQLQAADQDDDDFALDLIARRVPPIGRGAQLKKHQADKYRRQVLHELVAWWVGMQPETRTLSEKHRRFYHRFGIDIGTAFTLPAKETDALVDTIKKRFSEDMPA